MTQMPQLPYSKPADSEEAELILSKSVLVPHGVGTSSQGKCVRVGASFLLVASDQIRSEITFQSLTSTTSFQH